MYYTLLAMVEWHEETGDATALGVATRLTDLLCARFADDDHRIGTDVCNSALLDSTARLYAVTKQSKYLK
jgi:DUF1680 family protein